MAVRVVDTAATVSHVCILHGMSMLPHEAVMGAGRLLLLMLACVASETPHCSEAFVGTYIRAVGPCSQDAVGQGGVHVGVSMLGRYVCTVVGSELRSAARHTAMQYRGPTGGAVFLCRPPSSPLQLLCVVGPVTMILTYDHCCHLLVVGDLPTCRGASLRAVGLQDTHLMRCCN